MTLHHAKFRENQTSRKGYFHKRAVQAVTLIKVAFDMLKLLIYKYTPINPKQDSVEDISNHFEISHTLSTSGQPTQEHFKLIVQSGYTAVITLASGNFIESPLENEEQIVTGLRMTYHHIPVDFSNPTAENFNLFVNIMENLQNEKVWVHCFLNARASAFVYKYRIFQLGEDPQKVIWDLREIWEPFGVWEKFVYGNENMD